MVVPPVEPFADRYTQLRLVGRGGFGTVYKAWDPVLDRDVALKLLNADFAADSEWRKRFRKEAIAASKFHHPNITIVFDQGDYRDQPFIVMEFIDGEPLSKVIERRVPLSDSERILLLEQLCDGLHYAHQRNIIHRDIKPVNLIMREEHHAKRLVRTLKILDFGIAKIVDSAQTATGAMAFSPGYVSPEQIRGEGVDRRSDMFAVGAVAYELLVLKKAFDITSTDHFKMLNEMKRKMVDESHQPMTAVRPDVDPDLAAVVDRALAKDPDDRFSDLEEMRRSLQQVRERLEATQKGPSQTTVVLSPKQQTAVKLARAALESDDPTAAIAHLEDGLRAGHAGAGQRFLEQSLEEARERQSAKRAERRARDEAAAVEVINEARTAFARGDVTFAVNRLGEFEPATLVAAARDELMRARDALEEAAIAQAQAEERREQDRRKHERQEAERATRAIQSARENFQSGHCEAAIDLLESFEPAEPVAAVLSSMRHVDSVLRAATGVVQDGGADLRVQALDTLESVGDRALVEDALARLRRVHEKRLLNESAAAAVSAAEAEFDAGERRAALERLERYRPPHSLIEEARRRLRERNAALNAEEDRVRADEVVAHARAMFTQGDRAEAIAIVAAFEPADLVADVLDDLRRATDTIDLTSDAVRPLPKDVSETEPRDILPAIDDSPTLSEDPAWPVEPLATVTTGSVDESGRAVPASSETVTVKGPGFDEGNQVVSATMPSPEGVGHGPKTNSIAKLRDYILAPSIGVATGLWVGANLGEAVAGGGLTLLSPVPPLIAWVAAILAYATSTDRRVVSGLLIGSAVIVAFFSAPSGTIIFQQGFGFWYLGELVVFGAAGAFAGARAATMPTGRALVTVIGAAFIALMMVLVLWGPHGIGFFNGSQQALLAAFVLVIGLAGIFLGVTTPGAPAHWSALLAAGPLSIALNYDLWEFQRIKQGDLAAVWWTRSVDEFFSPLDVSIPLLVLVVCPGIAVIAAFAGNVIGRALRGVSASRAFETTPPAASAAAAPSGSRTAPGTAFRGSRSLLIAFALSLGAMWWVHWTYPNMAAAAEGFWFVVSAWMITLACGGIVLVQAALKNWPRSSHSLSSLLYAAGLAAVSIMWWSLLWVFELNPAVRDLTGEWRYFLAWVHFFPDSNGFSYGMGTYTWILRLVPELLLGWSVVRASVSSSSTARGWRLMRWVVLVLGLQGALLLALLIALVPTEANHLTRTQPLDTVFPTAFGIYTFALLWLLIHRMLAPRLTPVRRRVIASVAVWCLMLVGIVLRVITIG